MRCASVILLFLIALSGCGGSKKTTPPQSFNQNPDLNQLGISLDKVGSLDSLLQSYVHDGKTNCVATFVAKGGNVVYKKAFGLKNIADSIPATVDDYYVLFSQTKAVTTVAFMTLVEKGLVNIEDPVSKYFPDISDSVVTKVNQDRTYKARLTRSPMTFIHLLSHTSGLNAGLVHQIRRQGSALVPGFDSPIFEQSQSGQRSFAVNPSSKYLEEEMLELAQYPLGFDPGSEWDYHISTNMLAYMIEIISGQPFRDYVKETVLEPLDMEDTDWFYEPEFLERFVTPYRLIDGQLKPGSTIYAEGAVSTEQTYAEGAIGLNGPIEDYAKFCLMMLNGGKFNGRRILKPETVDIMTTINRLPIENSGGEGFQFGLGFHLANKKNKVIPAVSNSAYSWGGIMGTAYIIDPENDLITLFYVNMYEREDLYPAYLKKVYALFNQSQ